jgi:hypothetical protein
VSVDLSPDGGAVGGPRRRFRSAQAGETPWASIAVGAVALGAVTMGVLSIFADLEPAYRLLWVVETAFMLGTVGVALWRGDTPARWVAFAVLVDQIAVVLAETIGVTFLKGGTAFPVTKAMHLPIGIALLLALLAVAHRWPRPWLLWACAFQLAFAATYVAALLDASIRPLAFVTASNTWMLCGGVALLWGGLNPRGGQRRSTARDEAAAA